MRAVVAAKNRTLAGIVVLAAFFAIVAGALAAGRPADGLYAESAAAVDTAEYSNGAVDLQVSDGGREIRGSDSGVSCYTGAHPPAGVATYEDVTIHFPHNLSIAAGGSFSFSGPVTLPAEDSQEGNQTIETTYTIRGRFKPGKHGSFTATGTDTSPVCQPATVKKFTAKLYRG